ncbi:hypothetical protein V1264_011705 [Littorina saxatilis]|uniref:Protein sleepless n=2 Tax=Littorina saxatilis TaxID=31220 RepID=A0AAN9BVJ2_9CAEN
MAGASVCSVVCFFAALLATGGAIDCYKCTSYNGNDQTCEDPFKQDLSTVHLIARKCQYGYFSGTHCIKLKGIKNDGTHIVVRSCADADWGKNCGDIRYFYGDDVMEKIRGCLTTCNFDGCNTAPSRLAPAPVLLAMILLGAVWSAVRALCRVL